MELFEQFFSYSELIEITVEYENLESISDMLECLEGASRKLRRKGMCALYKILLKDYNASKERFNDTLVNTARLIVNQGGLTLLINHLSFISSQLQSDINLILEQELRMVLNILYTILTFLPREETYNEVSQYSYILEEALLSMIKLSTDYSYIPIKKVCMVLEKYLEMILDDVDKHVYNADDIKKEIPRCRLFGNSIECFYKRMIDKENNLSQVVVGLLRSLLACCPGPVGNGIDIKHEWESTIILMEQEPDLFSGSVPNNYVDESRHRVITGYSISKVILILLKKFRLNHYLQFQYLSQLINDANGILVFLKFLNLEFSDISKNPVFPSFQEVPRESLIENCLTTMLQVCYKTIKNHPDRIIANLIQFKSSLIFKKLLTKYHTEKIEIPCLKILRIQIKYLTKKWKTYPSNMKIISDIYQKLTPCKEDWIADSVVDKNSGDQFRQIVYDFNYYNYWQAMEDVPPESPKIPQDFLEVYEEWLEENVWGYSYMY